MLSLSTRWLFGTTKSFLVCMGIRFVDKATDRNVSFYLESIMNLKKYEVLKLKLKYIKRQQESHKIMPLAFLC